MEREWKANTGYISLFQRSVNTLLLARKISKAVKKLEKELQDAPWMDEEDRQARWAALHRENARLTHRHILRYRGFLTKVGQAASIKTGELPPAWIEELKGLQDELPISSLREVKQTVRADLGRPLEQVFRDFGERPIASASVAQAHAAYLISSGRKVCVKVQHRGVASMVGTDLATVEFICKRAAKYHPDAPDASDLIKEWRRASREEVDFKIEASNATQAAVALERSGLNVGCARPLPEYCGRRVLTMAFIEGWKITDVDRLPPGTDREALARPLVDAFALLVFQEGLIHGDPHPGNVFVEQTPDGRLRSALLDWGIVQRMTPTERVSAARWVLATLAQDRVMYVRSLIELGFEFDAYADQDSSSFLSFIEASMGSSAWMFRDSIPSSAQLQIMAQMQKQQEQQEKAEASGERQRQDASFTKVLSKIPGVVLFFLRGLEMLQNICGCLDVPLPFAEIVLSRAMPLVQARGTIPPPLPAPPGCPAVELAVRQRLQQLDDAGALIGAQVAVLACGGAHGPARWECRAACGRRDVTGGNLTDSMLVPLLENSLGVLLLCLFAAFERPTVTGKRLGLDTPVAQVWPDFSQREKGNITVAQLLQHRVGLARCFPTELSLKGFCTESRIEQAIAAAPRDRAAEALSIDEGGGAMPYRAVGIAVAALLRRSSGHARVAQAVAHALRPVGVQKDVAYSGEAERLARVGRKPQVSLPVEKIYEWLEDKASSLESQAASSAQWLTWAELHRERPAITDPLLVNRDVLRSGEACLPGRGIRATAEAMCTLFASDLVPPELIEETTRPCGTLVAGSHAEWRDIGCPLEVGVGGWRLFRVRRIGGGAQATGYGTVDGATGSVVLRLPEHSVAILLTSADKTTRGTGAALLGTVLEQLGWAAEWPQDPPTELPERGTRRGDATAPTPRSAIAASPSDSQMSNHLADLEAKVARLTQALERVAPGVVVDSDEDGEEGEDEEDEDAAEEGREEEAQPEEAPPALSGEWHSVETQGLDTLLEAFEVPSMVRAMAMRAKRSLRIELQGDTVTMETKTTMMGRSVEDTSTTFSVGEEFEGEQALGGPFRAISWWLDDGESPDAAAGVGIDDDVTPRAAPRRSLALEKHFLVEGREVVLEERIVLCGEDQLSLATTLRAPGDCEAPVCDAGDREILCNNLDAAGLRLRRALRLGDVQLQRMGRVVSCGPGTAPQRLTDVQRMAVPGTVTVRYDDLRATTLFKREGGAVAKPKAEAKKRKRRGGLLGLLGASDPASAEASPGGPEARGAAGAPGAPGAEARCLPAVEDGCAAARQRVARAAEDARAAAPVALAGCAMGVVAVAWAAGTALGVAYDLLGRGARAVCDDAPRGATAPLLPAPRGESGATIPQDDAPAVFVLAPAGEEFQATVDRSEGVSLGADLGRVRSDSPLGLAGGVVIVKRMRDEEGLFQQWNREHPEAAIFPRDIVVSVNGFDATDDLPRMMQEVRSRQLLTIAFRRGADRQLPAPAAAAGRASVTSAVSLAVEPESRRGFACDAPSAPSRSPPAASPAASPRMTPRHSMQATSSAGSRSVAASRSVAGAPPAADVAAAATRSGASSAGGGSRRGSAAAALAAAQGQEAWSSGRAAYPAAGDAESELSDTAALALANARAGRPPPAADCGSARVSEPAASDVAAPGVADPRPGHQEHWLSVIDFCCFDDSQENRDDRLALLATFADLPEGVALSAPCDRGQPKAFRNAEAAFHALKFWALGATFSRLSGRAALQKQLRLRQHADPTFAGYGCEWSAMSAVLAAKFAEGTAAAAALLATGDAFLLARVDPADEENSARSWSDGGDGEGANRLGLLLLVIRDRLSGRRGWTGYLQGLFDLGTGRAASPDAGEAWQGLVRKAAMCAAPTFE